MSLLHTHTHTHRKEVETYIHMYVYSKKGRRKTSDGRQTVQNKISNKIYRITKTKQKTLSYLCKSTTKEPKRGKTKPIIS